MKFLTLLIATLSALPYYAYSYCVYNKHSDDTHLEVRQYDPAPPTRAFHKDVYPGGKECCPYTTSDCNPQGGQLEPVRLWISRVNGRELTHFSVTLPAGGWVIVDGDVEHHTVAVKSPDGEYYPTTIEYGADYYQIILKCKSTKLKTRLKVLRTSCFDP